MNAEHRHTVRLLAQSSDGSSVSVGELRHFVAELDRVQASDEARVNISLYSDSARWPSTIEASWVVIPDGD